MSELKPCHFCGDDTPLYREVEIVKAEHIRHWIMCDCPAMIDSLGHPEIKNKDNLFHAWNKRTSQPSFLSKIRFNELFEPAYLEHLESTINNHDIRELLWMAYSHEFNEASPLNLREVGLVIKRIKNTVENIQPELYEEYASLPPRTILYANIEGE